MNTCNNYYRVFIINLDQFTSQNLHNFMVTFSSIVVNISFTVYIINLMQFFSPFSKGSKIKSYIYIFLE